MTLTPGAYLKCRRTAHGLAIEDVVGALATEPKIAWQDRADWIARIEADVVPASWSTIVALHQLYPFSMDVLEQLALIALGADVPAPRLCRICGLGGTTPFRPLWIPPWGWAQRDLCIPCRIDF